MITFDPRVVLAVVLIFFVVIIGILLIIILVKVLRYMKTIDKVAKAADLISDFPISIIEKILDKFFTN